MIRRRLILDLETHQMGRNTPLLQTNHRRLAILTLMIRLPITDHTAQELTSIFLTTHQSTSTDPDNNSI
jgi:hypothetical protein